MNNPIIRNTLQFVGILLLQALILNNIHLHVFVNPYIYPVFILLLPFRISAPLLMLLGFAMGLSIDIFTSTAGIHAAATVFIAFVRPYIIRLLTPKGGYDIDDQPSIKYMGLRWFLIYVLILIVLHHVVLFAIEIFDITLLIHMLLKVILSSLFSFVLIIMYEYLFKVKLGKHG